jgi:hypothetical protein
LIITDTPDAPTAPIDTATPDGEVVESPTPEGTGADLAAEADGAHPELDTETSVPEASQEASVSADSLEASSPEDSSESSVAAEHAPAASPNTPDADTTSAPTTPTKAPKRARRTPTTPGSAQERRTTAQRLGNFPRADRPADIPAPDHHHLPGWVRRDFARARPPLSNILALLEGDTKDAFATRINELTEGISSGKFSLAWQYPDLVDEGRTLYEKQRRETAESARANRQLDTARRRVQDRIRDAGDNLTADVAARLQRQLRSAGGPEAITAVASELDGVATAAKTTAEKRREREIERTRARIMRSAAAAGAADAPPQQETWQDVLRRFAEQQAAGSRSSE